MAAAETAVGKKYMRRLFHLLQLIPRTTRGGAFVVILDQGVKGC